MPHESYELKIREVQKDYPFEWKGAPVIWSKGDAYFQHWITFQKTEGRYPSVVSLFAGGSMIVQAYIIEETGLEFIDAFIDSMIESLAPPMPRRACTVWERISAIFGGTNNAA